MYKVSFVIKRQPTTFVLYLMSFKMFSAVMLQRDSLPRTVRVTAGDIVAIAAAAKLQLLQPPRPGQLRRDRAEEETGCATVRHQLCQ